jgi:hypothetical protein
MSTGNKRLLEKYYRVLATNRNKNRSHIKPCKEPLYKRATNYVVNKIKELKDKIVAKTQLTYTTRPTEIHDLFKEYQPTKIKSYSTEFNEKDPNLEDILNDPNQTIISANAQDSLYKDRFDRRIDATTYNPTTRELTIYRIYLTQI